MTEQIVVVYPDAQVAQAGYAGFPKSWDAAFGPLPSHVLVRRADDARGKLQSVVLRIQGVDIPWDNTIGPPPRVAVTESLFAAIAVEGEHRSLIATAVRATVGVRIRHRLSRWSSTGWVLPSVDLIGGDGKPAH